MLADISVFAPHTKVLEHFGSDKKGILMFKGRLVTALRFPDLVFPKGKREDAFSVTRTDIHFKTKSYNPVINTSWMPAHFYYRKEFTAKAQGTVIQNWNDKKNIDLFWESQSELLNDDPKSKPYLSKYRHLPFEGVDWCTDTGKEVFYTNMAKLYLLDIEEDGFPAHNIAIVLGQEHGYFCFDIDVKDTCKIEGYSEDPMDNIKLFEKLLFMHGYTLNADSLLVKNQVKTPYPFCYEKTKSGGYHFYFKMQSGINGEISKGTKGFTFKFDHKTSVLHWDLLSDRPTTLEDLGDEPVGRELLQSRKLSFAKSYGQEKSGFYEFVVPPFDEQGNCNVVNVRDVITEIDYADLEIRTQLGSKIEVGRLVGEYRDFMCDDDLRNNDLTYFMDTLILTRCIVKIPHRKTYYIGVESSVDTILTKCVQTKSGQKEFRVDSIITSMDMYAEYVYPILDAIPSWKNMTGRVWRILINFIKRVVGSEADFYQECVKDFVERCRGYKDPDDKQVEQMFTYKLKTHEANVANHHYLAAVLRNAYGVRPEVFQKWDQLVPTDFHLEYVKNASNIWFLKTFRPPYKPDLETEIWNFDKKIPYAIDMSDGLTYSSVKECRTWKLEDAVRWVKHCIVHITAGGKPYYLTKNVAENDEGVADIVLEKVTCRELQETLSGYIICERTTTVNKKEQYEKVTAWDVVNTFRAYVSYDREIFSFIHKNERYKKGRDSLFNICKQCVGATIPYFDFLTVEQQATGLEGIKTIISTLVGCPKKYDDPRYILSMDWLSDMIRNPTKKPGIMPYLYSHTHGAGKTKFFEFLSNFVIGDYYSSTMSMHNFEKFNAIIKNKLFIFISEASRSDMRKYEAQLKSFITDVKQTIELKGVDACTTKSHARMAMSSNEQMPMDPENRRYMLWEPVFNKSDEYIAMYEELFESDRSKYYGALFYDYLANTHEVTTKNFRFALQAIPINQTAEIAIFASLHPILKYVVEEIRDGENDFLSIDPLNEEEHTFVGKDFLKKFRDDTGFTYDIHAVEVQFNIAFSKDGETYYEYKKVKRNNKQLMRFVFNNWAESVKVLFTNLKLMNMYARITKSEVSEMANELVIETYNDKSDEDVRNECEIIMMSVFKNELSMMNRNEIIARIEQLRCKLVDPTPEL